MMLAYNPHIKMAIRMTLYATIAGPLLMLAYGSVPFFSGTDSAGLEDVLRFTLEVSFVFLILGFVFGLKIGALTAFVTWLFCRKAQHCERAKLVTGLLTVLFLLPFAKMLPAAIEQLPATVAKLYAVVLVLPYILALYWSQVVARKYIADVNLNRM